MCGGLANGLGACCTAVPVQWLDAFCVQLLWQFHDAYELKQQCKPQVITVS